MTEATTEIVTSIGPSPRLRIQAMKEYHPPLGSRDLLRLDFNENTLACSPKVREVLGSISAGELTRYPEREPVEGVVAAHLQLAAEQVALTNGVDEAIHVLFEAFLEAGDELLLPVPTYTMYEVYASATGADMCHNSGRRQLQFPLRAAASQPLRRRQKSSPSPIPTALPALSQRASSFLRSLTALRMRCLLVDEAYFHFHGETLIDLRRSSPEPGCCTHLLQGLRARRPAPWMCSLVPLQLMRWVRRVLSPYSVNSLALACLPPAPRRCRYTSTGT